MSQSVHESGFIRSNAFWDQHLSYHHAAWHDALTNIHSQEPHLCIKTKLLAPSYQHVMIPSVSNATLTCLLLVCCMSPILPWHDPLCNSPVHPYSIPEVD